MSDEKIPTIEDLPLKASIGFSGNVSNGLILHNDDKRLIYPLGSSIVVKNLEDNTQYFIKCGSILTTISCIALSNDGTLLAVGQKTHQGFPVSILVYELETSELLHCFDLYKTEITAIKFSPKNTYLLSLGCDNDNRLVLWDLKTGKGVCSAKANNNANEIATCIKFTNNDENTFISAGKYTFKIWHFNNQDKKITCNNCELGQLKRIFTCLNVSLNDEIIYAGTSSGDLLEISMKNYLFKKQGPIRKRKKKNNNSNFNDNKFSMGIHAICIVPTTNNIIVGTGNGKICLLNYKNLSVLKELKIEKQEHNTRITSIVLNKNYNHFFVGTSKSTIYLCKLDNFDYELRHSGHFKEINNVCFPKNISDIFVTAGINDIRIWNTNTCKELLRIKVPNLTCNCILLSNKGDMIITGWNDGNIRAFYPQSGKLMFKINNAHSDVNGGVSSICLTDDGDKLITGGYDSLIRIWKINQIDKIKSAKMLISLREHQSKITCIKINNNNTQFISCSFDGSCVIWDLNKLHRINAFFNNNTQFTSVLYHPDQSQFLTSGTDKQVSYWNSINVNRIRDVLVSDTTIDNDKSNSKQQQKDESGAINSIDIDKIYGNFFITASDDTYVKLFNYNKGLCYNIGKAHSLPINDIKISPNNKYAVSVGKDAAIMIWEIPERVNE